jgi:hypothetical protein
MAASNNPARNKQLNTNAAKRIKAPKVTQTKVNTPERQAEVNAWRAERPAGGSRADYIAWGAENPNQISNAGRRLAAARPKTPKTAKPPKAPK